jgi:ferredoxin-NADP reductase
MSYQFYDAEVIKIEDESDAVKRFYFKMPDEIIFEFKAGQFVMLDLPLDAKFTNRSYSIASAPSNDNIFELCIVINEDGLGTPWIWENVEVGTKLKCTSALGKFVLPETIDCDLCFVATGTGIAPVRSMIGEIYNKNIPHQDIYVIFGNRFIKDILYRNEFDSLQTQHPEFHFIPVLSRETAETWKGTIGYVHQVYEKIFADNRRAYFYLCGWSAMVKEARDRLKARGYTKNELKFELFD